MPNINAADGVHAQFVPASQLWQQGTGAGPQKLHLLSCASSPFDCPLLPSLYMAARVDVTATVNASRAACVASRAGSGLPDSSVARMWAATAACCAGRGAVPVSVAAASPSAAARTWLPAHTT